MIQHLPFREQVQTVRLAGFQELSLHPFVIGQSVAAGLSLADMKAILNSEGVKVGRIDPLATWAPDWRAKNFGLDFNLTTATDPLAIFDLCSHFESSRISLNAMWPLERYSLDEVVEHFGTICARAATYELTCDIEPIPMWGIRRMEDALEILRRSGVPNGGLVVDLTHLFRGETPLDVLATVPGEWIGTVQICDGLMPKPVTLTLEEECFSRLWPGEGGFPISEAIKVLKDIGGLRNVGLEVFSPTYAKEGTPADVIADRARKTLLRYSELCL